MVDFDEVCRKLPVMRDIEAACQGLADKKYYEMNRFWYDVIKPVVVKKVGNNADFEELRSSECYSMVYDHLCQILNLREKDDA